MIQVKGDDDGAVKNFAPDPQDRNDASRGCAIATTEQPGPQRSNQNSKRPSDLGLARPAAAYE